MYKSVAIVLLVSLFQGYFSLDRDVIFDTYSPVLQNFSTQFTAEGVKASDNYDVILEELRNNTIISVSTTNTQITNLRATIADAKAQSANKTNVLACIGPQEIAAAGLSAVIINSTCYVGVSYPNLEQARDNFTLLASIPNNTISACTLLNPLISQDQLYLDCIVNKILDLQTQLGSVQGHFNDVRNETIRTNVGCLTTQSGLVIQQINEIYYETTVCLALGKKVQFKLV